MTAELFERDQELAAIDSVLARAREGVGRVVVVEGQAGIGKTALLEHARDRATAIGMQALVGRGGPLEAQFPFGVVRQLFERALRRRSAADRRRLLGGAAASAAPVIGIDVPLGDPRGVDMLRVLHGLYWLCSNLCDQTPALVVVDDGHAADRESVRWLSYMAHRVEDLPLALVVAARPGEEPHGGVGMAALAAVDGTTVVRPGALSDRSSALLVRALRGDGAEDAFCHACHAATGGVPFYLRELVIETEREGIAPVAGQAERVSGLGPRAISAATLARLARLAAPAAALARAVAILGLAVELRHAARLAGTDVATAELAADALAAAGVLEPRRPLGFSHPVVAEAIYADIQPGARSRAHARAAELLASEGRDAGTVASHLLRVEPGDDPTTLERLERAAAEARERGAPETAAAYLARAVAEAADPEVRARLLYALGEAELLAAMPGAGQHLRQAVELASDPRLVVRATTALCNALGFVGRFEDADELAAQTIERIDDPSSTWRLRGVQLQLTTYDSRLGVPGERIGDLVEQATAAGADASLVLFVGALRLAALGDRSGAVPALVAQGMGDGRFLAVERDDSFAVGMAVCALAFLDRLEAADDVLAAVIDDARARGSVMPYIGALVWRGWVELRRGRIGSAEADERAAAELSEQHELWFALPWARAFLAAALLERGETEGAAETIDAVALDDLPVDSLAGMALDVRGRLRLAQGRGDEGVTDLEAGGARLEGMGALNPNITHWRSHLAVALGRESPRAAALLDTELARSREVGCARAIGVALWARGLIAGGDGIGALEEAVAVLAPSPARLEHARALLALGGALRRARRRADARDPLRRALDLADRLGAEALADQARAELASAGARPRRHRLSGADSLTATERRVAEMATTGLKNREIAQALFVSRKTVEMHLANAYRKLEINSRGELAGALASTRSDASAAR